MKRIDRTAMIEHLAFESGLPIEHCCKRIGGVLGLPDFSFEASRKGKWGYVEVDHVEYHISQPFEPGKLQEWDSSVPKGCNCGISLIVFREHAHADDRDWIFDSIVAPIGETLASQFERPIFHHRTWLGVGNNIRRDLTFECAAV